MDAMRFMIVAYLPSRIDWKWVAIGWFVRPLSHHPPCQGGNEDIDSSFHRFAQLRGNIYPIASICLDERPLQDGYIGRPLQDGYRAAPPRWVYRAAPSSLEQYCSIDHLCPIFARSLLLHIYIYSVSHFHFLLLKLRAVHNRINLSTQYNYTNPVDYLVAGYPHLSQRQRQATLFPLAISSQALDV
jgi:hypothetical protein